MKKILEKIAMGTVMVGALMSAGCGGKEG